MGIIMPETCWAVSVRQSNKILRLFVASIWVFYLSDWRCTEPQTLSPLCLLLLYWYASGCYSVVISWLRVSSCWRRLSCRGYSSWVVGYLLFMDLLSFAMCLDRSNTLFRSPVYPICPDKAVITYTRKKGTQGNPATATTHNIYTPRTRRDIRTSVNDSA